MPNKSIRAETEGKQLRVLQLPLPGKRVRMLSQLIDKCLKHEPVEVLQNDKTYESAHKRPPDVGAAFAHAKPHHVP